MDSVLSLSLADAMGALLVLTLGVMVVLLSLRMDGDSRPPPLKRMIGRAGGKLDTSADPLLGASLATAARICKGCENLERCEFLLAENFDGEIPDYCPNRRWFRSLTERPA
ncbi:MAG: hypothetical protein IMF05_06110 [Proteobacteria bacterium]|nr:hypothetical protein [Pseudomonadota bacterium]